ncbi:MAG: hypothetical protein HOL48_02495 [Porticoccaceae bacterium]|jgi:hypothetical protein|nr:hypothetical protein [Porticoccaceae bacterium]
MKRLLIMAGSIVFVSCSVQFRQLDMLNQIREANTDPLEGIAWNMDWNGDSYTLYAATEGDQTLFGGYGDKLLGFDGFDLTNVIGFLPNDDIGRIEIEGDDLLYFVNDRLVVRHVCQSWETQQQTDGGLKFTRSCVDDSRQQGDRRVYQNEFEINPAGELSRLRFLLHPDYPTMTMTPIENPS